MVTALAIAVVLLGLLLAGVTREWLILRFRERHRTLFRRWPLSRIPLDQFDSRFAPDAFGPTRAAEVTMIGRGTMSVLGGTTDTEAWILAVVAKGANRMFEFGTGTGKTAYLWARNQPEGGKVTTLTLGHHQVSDYRNAEGDDPLAVQYAQDESALTTFLYSGTAAESQIEQLFGDSKSFDESPFVESCDVVFVDGSHAYSYVVSDTQKALRMVKPGGLVLWHDFNLASPGVFQAIKELSKTLPLVQLEGTDIVGYRRPKGA
jgi:SAM-dependent methyltransferase